MGLGFVTSKRKSLLWKGEIFAIDNWYPPQESEWEYLGELTQCRSSG